MSYQLNVLPDALFKDKAMLYQQMAVSHTARLSC